MEKTVEVNVRGTLRGPGSQAVLLAATTGTAQVILAILYVATARSTSPANYGAAVVAIAAGTSVVGLLDFGTNSYWVRELAQKRLSIGELNRRLTAKLLVAASACGVWILVCVAVLDGSELWVAGPIGLAIMWNQSMQVPLRAAARNDRVAVTILADKVVAGVTFAVFGLSAIRPVDRLWLCLVLGACSAGLLGWTWTPLQQRARLVFSLRVNPWSGAGHYGLSTLATSAQTYDLPVLGAVGGSYAAGLYGAVNRWTQPMGLLSGAFVSASLPFMASAKSFKAGLEVVRRGLWLPAIAMLVCLVVAVAAPLVVTTLLGPGYAGSADVLRTLAIATSIGIINQPLFVFIQARRHDRAVAWLMVCAVAIQLVMVVVLAHTMGALGAAFAILALQVILLVGCSSILVRLWRRDE